MSLSLGIAGGTFTSLRLERDRNVSKFARSNPTKWLHSLRRRDSHDNGTIPSLIQPIQHGHILVVKLEVVDRRVHAYSLRSITLRQNHPSPLQTPSNQDLVGGDLVLGGHLHEGRDFRFLVPDDRAVGLQNNAKFLAEFGDFFLLAPRVKLSQCQSNVAAPQRPKNPPSNKKLWQQAELTSI